MSDLRNQLDSAKRNYQSARYPGNLAEELLSAPRRRPVLKMFIGAASGLAAAIAIVILLHDKTGVAPTNTTIATNTKPAVVTTQTTEDDEDAAPVTSLAALPSFPDDVSIASADTTSASTTRQATAAAETEYVPMAPSFSSMDLGSMPSLPSMDFSFTDTDTTSQQTSKEST